MKNIRLLRLYFHLTAMPDSQSLSGTEKIAGFVSEINAHNVDYIEAQAAKEYFSFYHTGLNRRTDDPVNSRLNYGYAVVRSAIARSLAATGFHPTFGIHHDSQLYICGLFRIARRQKNIFAESMRWRRKQE